jgi:hypothetical protein
MLRMDQVHVIRHKVLVEGHGIRRAAAELGVCRNTIRPRPNSRVMKCYLKIKLLIRLGFQTRETHYRTNAL